MKNDVVIEILPMYVPLSFHTLEKKLECKQLDLKDML
jgi:hypothetical protein